MAEQQVNVTVRVPEDVRASMVERAKASGQTLSEFLRDVLVGSVQEGDGQGAEDKGTATLLLRVPADIRLALRTHAAGEAQTLADYLRDVLAAAAKAGDRGDPAPTGAGAPPAAPAGSSGKGGTVLEKRSGPPTKPPRKMGVLF